MLFDKLKRLADEKGISIKQLEEQAGLANGTIGKWRESEPSVMNLSRVTQILGASIDDLIRED